MTKLQYQPAEPASEWISIIKLVAALAAVSGSAGVLTELLDMALWLPSSLGGGMPRIGSNREILQLVIVLLMLLVNAALLVAAIGCFSRHDGMRRLLIACCWAKLGMITCYSLLGLFVYPGRATTMALMRIVTLRTISWISSGLFPLAAALLLARPAAQRAFAERSTPPEVSRPALPRLPALSRPEPRVTTERSWM